MLDRITLTGADENTDIRSMIQISAEFPIIEWGILISRSQEGGSRFPSLAWQKHFVVATLPYNLQLSTHVCGSLVKDLLVGKSLHLNIDSVLYSSSRMQINTHAETHEVEPKAFIDSIDWLGMEQVIIQYDNVNNHLLDILKKSGNNAAPLFDLSHGAGILPSEWPAYIQPYCGYAGGLSPDNVAEQLVKIRESAGDNPFWIDAETHLRTNGEFDLNKCYDFVKNATKEK